MSKLTEIRKALQENPDITIVPSPKKDFLPDAKGKFSHTISFVVVPKNNRHPASKLQDFMKSLIPGIEPSYCNQYSEEGGQNLFGLLSFYEDIGTITTSQVIILAEDDMDPSDGFVDGKLVIEQTEILKRIISVALFPNLEVANLAINGNDPAIPFDSPLNVPLTKLKRLI